MTSSKKIKAALALTAFICLAASTSHATITITSASGVSRADAPQAGLASFNIYGGLAHSPTSASCAGNGTCNTCYDTNGNFVPLDNTFTGCNEQAIQSSGYVIITFTSAVTGYPIAYDNSSGGTNLTAINDTTTTGTNQIAAGTQATLRIKWSNICALTGIGSADCIPTTGVNSSTTFAIGISTSPSTMAGSTTEVLSITANIIPKIDGYYLADDKICTNSDTTATQDNYCYYELYPGDGKVTVQNVASHGSPESLYSSLRFYFEPASTQPTTTDGTVPTVSNADFGLIKLSSFSADLPLDPQNSGGFIGNGRVTGLTNNVLYVSKMAHVDKGGNLGLFTSDYSSGSPTAGLTYVADTNCDSGTQCHVSEPGAVEGILSKNVNCFIATASYGSPFAAKVQTFRDFRNRFLLTNKIGLKLTEFYYDGFGPRAAKVIRGSETLRAMSRTALFPVWVFATLSLELGFFGALLASLGILVLIAATLRVCSQHLRMDA